MSLHLRDEFDLSAVIAEGCRLIEGEVIHRYNFRRGAKRNAIPAEEARDFEVAGSWEEADEDEGGGLKHKIIIRQREFPMSFNYCCFLERVSR